MKDISISAKLRSSLFKSPITAEAADYIDAQAARIEQLERDCRSYKTMAADAIHRLDNARAGTKAAREDALREAIDEVHQECWTDGPMSETLMAERSTTALAIRAIQSLINKEPKP